MPFAQIIIPRVILLWAYFHFPSSPQNHFFIFAACGENEYRQKAFRFNVKKWCCRYPGGFQRRPGRSAFGTRFCPAKSSVLYLCSAADGKGGCRHEGQLTLSGRRADGFAVLQNYQVCKNRLPCRGDKMENGVLTSRTPFFLFGDGGTEVYKKRIL